MSIFAKSKIKKNPILSDVEERETLGGHLGFAASEAYKMLRTNLIFSLTEDKPCRVVGITSSVRSEGKSTTSLNLGYALAQDDKRVLVIEGDMRLPTFSRRLQLEKTQGLSDLLVGICTGSEIIQNSGLHPNLKVIAAGSIPPNPAELLGSKRMEVTIETLSKGFDFILLDLPPVSAVSDPLIASKLVDGMLLVVRQGRTNRRMLDEVVRQIKFSNVKLLGFVVTCSDTQKKKYGRYGKYYRYGYGYGYGAHHTNNSATAGGENTK